MEKDTKTDKLKQLEELTKDLYSEEALLENYKVFQNLYPNLTFEEYKKIILD